MDVKYKKFLNVCLNLTIVLEIAFRGGKYGFVHTEIKQNDWSEFKNNILKKDYFSESNSSTLQSAMDIREATAYISRNKKYS
ncbi:hypothetical protein [Acinetobacter baumannii]|uniref:hypothetical protein n=1 Tax=Acinetobacter baumannii TaxID=470 RepID=UPI001C0B8B70|nr:hypothetical protein [Acinetobacter baumannii]MBU3081576.1 hypothetical protein [Acinetobacter baumannii]